MTYSDEVDRKVAREREATPAFRKRMIQRLFEKMADEFPGEVRLERWYKDGSARVAFGISRGRVRLHWRGAPLPVDLVRVERLDGGALRDHVWVSPVPSAVIAVSIR